VNHVVRQTLLASGPPHPRTPVHFALPLF
jgi:hypothetical protein